MPAKRSPVEVTTALLPHLRTVTGNDDLAYAEPPSEITGGYDTSIYAFRLNGADGVWSGGLILRVFRPDTAAEQARYEATLQEALVDQGFPAPRVTHVCEDSTILGGAFMIMERVPGRIMLDLFFRPSPIFFRLRKMLAETQAQLHAVDTAPILAAIDGAGFPPERYSLDARYEAFSREIERLSLRGLQPAMEWLVKNRPAAPDQAVICHGDFHPINILVDHGKVSGVIDWGWFTLADPAYDVGATIAIFKHGPVDLPDILQGVIDTIRGWMSARYRASYEESRELDPQAVEYFETLRSLGFLVEAGEHIVAPRPGKPSPFTSPRQIENISARISEITGVSVSLP